MRQFRQTGSGFYSPALWLALLANVAAFTAFFWLATYSVRKDVAFVSKELMGLQSHRAMMQHYRAAPTPDVFDAMRDIADTSNLILDPELGSYYMMNLVIRHIPDLMQAVQSPHTLADGRYLQRIIDKALRSLRVAGESGVDVVAMQKQLEALRFGQLSMRDLDALYAQSSQQLEKRLKARQRADERLWSLIALTIIGLFVFSSFLLAVSINYLQRRRAYKAVQEKIAMLNQLEKANSELERFSYFTAHDLKEPVRSISCFSTLLGEAMSKGDSAQSQSYLAIIEQSAQRMSQLIDGILRYLAADKNSVEQPQTISLRDAVQSVISDLQQAIVESNADITLASLPQVSVPPLALHRVLMNLIGNAIAYRHPPRRCHVHISGEWSHLGWKINIVDNGLGFASRYAAQVFEPFKRLHDDAPVRGSGIGLSICKKLVEGWGGTIGVSAQEGLGAQFYFTVPASAHPKAESASLPASSAHAKQQPDN